MNEQLITRKIILNTTPTNLWDALTNPEKTKLYMSNCSVHSSWEIGKEIYWKGNFQGYESGKKGVILNIIPKKELKYSSIDPNFGIEDKPENYLHITYQLVEEEKKTILVTKIENFNNDPERIKHIANAWDNIVLPALEKLFN